MFRNIRCFNTINGKVLTWDILEGHVPVKISIYGTYDGKGWTLLCNNCETNFYVDNVRTVGLQVIYRIVGVDNVGNKYEVTNIGTASIDSKAGLVAKELNRRERAMYKAHPIGRADVTILMRKTVGTICPDCQGSDNCPTEGPDNFCTTCFGTGVKGGYVIYPKKEPMLLLNQHDDQLQPPPELFRNGATQQFRTVFTGMLREKDILCVGMDLYTVNASQCVASAGTIPVVYIVDTFKLLPEDIRYTTLMEKIKNGR